MTGLRVFTVPPEYLPAGERSEGDAVVLGDCLGIRKEDATGQSGEGPK